MKGNQPEKYISKQKKLGKKIEDEGQRSIELNSIENDAFLHCNVVNLLEESEGERKKEINEREKR